MDFFGVSKVVFFYKTEPNFCEFFKLNPKTKPNLLKLNIDVISFANYYSMFYNIASYFYLY